MIKRKIIIIGAGPAGLAAAIAANRSGVPAEEILLLERDTVPGGILNQCIHAGFGLTRFGEELTGPEYSARFADEVAERGIKIETDCTVLSVSEDRVITLISPTLGYTAAEADAVILAMGCRERPRGALNIPGFRPSGVFTAGTAQRYVNIDGYMPGEKVVILGSGDIGLIMARRLTLEGAEVKCVAEIMPYSGGLRRNIVQCLDDFGIPLLLSHTVVNVKGRERVEAVVLAEVDGNRQPIAGTEKEIECDTLLLSVGLIPENELTRGAGIELDPRTKGASVNQFRETECPGIFSCGNVLHVHDLVDYVSEEAEIAGGSAADRVLGKTSPAVRTVAVKPGDNVSYTVPQRIDITDGNDVTVYFRVNKIIDGATVRVKDGHGNSIAVRKRPIAVPGEMETVRLTCDMLASLDGSITVEVTGKH